MKTWISTSRELPTKCSFCNERAVAVIDYHSKGFFGRWNFRLKFFCEGHREIFADMTVKDQADILLGKEVMETPIRKKK